MKKVRYFVLTVLFALLAACFPYVADDWVWGLDGSFTNFLASFSDESMLWHFYNNGRYLGNGLGFFCANHPWLRVAIMALTLSGLLCTIAAMSGKDESVWLAGLLLLCCPRARFTQGISWCSAFMIYAVGAFIAISALRVLIDRKGAPIFAFILPFVGSFFVENLSIGCTLFAALWIAYRLLRHEKVEAREWLWLAGAVLGTALMLSDDGYRAIFTGNAEDTYWNASVGTPLTMLRDALRTFRDSVAEFWLGSPWILSVCGFVALCLLTRDRLCAPCAAVLTLALTLRQVELPGIRGMAWAYAGLIGLYSLFYGVILLRHGSKRLCALAVFCVCVTAPLIVAEPLSERVFLPTYFCQLLLVICVFAEIPRQTVDTRVWRGAFLGIFAFLLTVYAILCHYDAKRLNYLRRRESEGVSDSVLAKLPLSSFVTVTYPYDYWLPRYQKFYGLSPEVQLHVVSFDEWRALPDYEWEWWEIRR